MNLAYRGLIGPATGWLGRAQRLLDAWPEQTAEHGLLLIPLVFQHEAAGDFAAAAAVAREAAAIGERFGDRDLFAMALHAEGHMLVKAGRVREGLALLDESMVAVTTQELRRSSSASSTAASSWRVRPPSRSLARASGRRP